MPDRDAVADQFYQLIGKSSKIKKFKAGQVELILELDYDKYLKINEHREVEEEGNSVQVVGQKRHRATLSHDHGPSSSSQTSDVYTAEAPIPPIPAALTAHPTFPTPALLPPSLHQETSTDESARINTYHSQKVAKFGTLQPSKINQKVQDTVRTSFHIYCHIDLTISKFQIGSSTEIPSATTGLNTTRLPYSKRLRGALLGIKTPGPKVIRKMSKSCQ